MRGGEFEEGAHVLRARIDMASPNMNLRDPVIYRILHAPHPMTGDAWHVYPMYDFAQALSDAIEGVTHSLCTLEFEDHRPLYEWFLDTLKIQSPPRQIEFGRLNLTHTVMSKRYLTRLVEGGHVDGWDDPRMPTLAGMRRRGFTPEALRDFCDRVGVTKNDGAVEFERLETCVRSDLERKTWRAMAVLRPLKLVIENYPEDASETFEAPNHPADPALGAREVPFSRELFIERDDFMEDPPRKFFRFAPGREVRLRYACLVTCTGVDRDPRTGAIVGIRGRYDPGSRGGKAPDGRKVRGAVHWVCARRGVRATVRLYDRLFRDPAPGRDVERLAEEINPDSLEVLESSVIEPSLGLASPGDQLPVRASGLFRGRFPGTTGPGRPCSTAPSPCATSGAGSGSRGTDNGVDGTGRRGGSRARTGRLDTPLSLRPSRPPGKGARRRAAQGTYAVRCRHALEQGSHVNSASSSQH